MVHLGVVVSNGCRVYDDHLSCALVCKQGRKGPGTAGLCRIPAVPPGLTPQLYAPVRDDLSAAPETATSAGRRLSLPISPRSTATGLVTAVSCRCAGLPGAGADPTGCPQRAGWPARPFRLHGPVFAEGAALPGARLSGEGLTAGPGWLTPGRHQARWSAASIPAWAKGGWTLPRHGIRLGNRATSLGGQAITRHRRDVCAESRFSAP